MVEHGEHGRYHSSIDEWTGDTDEDYCYSCSKFVEADMDSKCPICEADLDWSGDEWGSGDTAKASISSAPSVTTSGDMWDRSGSAYTWGKQTTWNQHHGSSMSGAWSGGWYDRTSDNANAQRLLRHKNALDSLCKVVEPTIGHSLRFATSATAYTNMNTGDITIDGTLLKNNDDKLDIVSGLAIHEKLHLVHTKPLVRWEREYAYDNKLDGWESKLLHSIGNTVEDEYIEKQLAKDCAGFVQYISATKDYYFNEKVKDMLEKPNENPYLDLLNTLLAFVRYPANINIDRKKRHSKHIQFFARALHGALDSRPNVLKAVETLYIYMKKVAEKMADDMDDPDYGDKIAEKMDDLRKALADSELSSKEWEEIESKIKRDMAKSESHREGLDKLLHKHGSHDSFKKICGSTDYDKHKETISEDLAEEIKELEDTDYHETVLGKSECVSPRQTKVTWRTAQPDEGEKARYKADSQAIRKQTGILKRKIQLYGNRNVLTIRNQKRGKLDKRILHRIPMGRRDIFKATIVDEDKPLDVCLLVDESGSMCHYMHHARKSCIAVKEALEENSMLDLWVMGHTADGYSWHTDNNSTNMTLYHSPSLKDRPLGMGAMKARCENRDGNAILSAAQRVKEETATPMSQKLMIVFSDGSPAAIGYGGSSGIEHTRKCVKSLEGKGWNIIQVGFGGAHYQERMFTNHCYVNNIDNLGNTISKIIRKVIKV
tara:strand:+ start:706 stop:2850 length:2145 start_codon:yes stop_codon:yes gene_type:complete